MDRIRVNLVEIWLSKVGFFFAFIRGGRKAKNSSESQISTRLYQCNQPWFTDATVQFIPPAAANKYRSGQQVGNNVGWLNGFMVLNATFSLHHGGQSY